MARISSLQPFTGGDFQEFEERLEFYFFANDIGTVAASANAADKLAASKKRKAVLVNLLSAEVYSILTSLCLPAKVADKKLSEICDLLRKYFQPALSQVSATFNFHQLKQKENESTADFIIRLKRLAVRCEFADHLDRALRDQFIAGLSSSSTRNFLLTKEDTSAQSFNDIVKLALTQESAARAAVQLTSQQEVHKVNHRPVESRSQAQSGVSRQSHQSREQRLCYRCGSTQHLADKCKHKATVTNISRDHLCAPFFGTKAIPFCMHPAMSGCPAASSVLYLLSVVCMYPFLAAVHVAVCSPFCACTHFWLPCMSRCALFLRMYPFLAAVHVAVCSPFCACIRFWLLQLALRFPCSPMCTHVHFWLYTHAYFCLRADPEESLEPSMDPVIRM